MRTGRVVWFVAGSAVGVYASVKVRRAAQRLSMPGLIDQAAALGVGARAFAAEFAEGRRAKENEIRHAMLDEPQRWEIPEERTRALTWEKDSI